MEEKLEDNENKGWTGRWKRKEKKITEEVKCETLEDKENED